jgi:hypothetical protein
VERIQGRFWQRGEGEGEEEPRRGPCPFLLRKRRGATMLAAMYPATKLRSPRAYGVVLSTVRPTGNET